LPQRSWECGLINSRPSHSWLPLFRKPALKSCSSNRFQVLSITPAQAKFRSILQNDNEVPMRPRLEFLYSIEIHDCRTVYSRESLRVQLPFNVVERVAHEIRLFSAAK